MLSFLIKEELNADILNSIMYNILFLLWCRSLSKHTMALEQVEKELLSHCVPFTMLPKEPSIEIKCFLATFYYYFYFGGYIYFNWFTKEEVVNLSEYFVISRWMWFFFFIIILLNLYVYFLNNVHILNLEFTLLKLYTLFV